MYKSQPIAKNIKFIYEKAKSPKIRPVGSKYIPSKVKYVSYSRTPTVRIYGPNGLTVEYLRKHNFDTHDSFMIVYRNIIRLIPYWDRESYLRGILHRYVRFRFLDDYNYRRKKVCGLDQPLDETQVLQRSINSLNFLNNACCNGTPGTERTMSKEFRILDGIIQHENSKINSKIIKRFGVKSLDDVNGKVDESWYSYIDKLQKKQASNNKGVDIVDFMKVVIGFDRSLVLFNEECELML